MININWRRIAAHLTAYPASYLALFTIFISFIISIKFPVYFRSDSIWYLESVHNTSNPFEVFNPVRPGLIFGHYRPMIHLAMWILYHLFGLNAFPYQLFNFLIYGLSFVFFFKLTELTFSKRTAFLTLILYSIVFFWIAFIPFSFEHATFIIEVFFLQLSLYFLILAIKGKRNFFLGLFFYFCAALSKEPAMIIIPSCFLFYLLYEWKGLDAKKRATCTGIAAAMWCVAIIGIAISPLNSSSPLTTSQIFPLISYRWCIYSNYLLSNFGILIWISTLFLSFRYLPLNKYVSSSAAFYIAITSSIVISAIIKPFPNAALFILFIAFIPIVIKKPKVSFAIVWFSVSLLGFMVIKFVNRAYLTEASFGIAILMGVVLNDIISHFEKERYKLPSKYIKVSVSVLIILSCFGLFLYIPKVKEKLDTLHVVSANRLNFRDNIEFILANLNDQPISLIIIDYEDMGLTYEKDVYTLNDMEKAQRQKTIDIEWIIKLLQITNKHNIQVNNLQWFKENSGEKKCYLFVMNNYEQKFVENLNLKKEVIFKASRNNEDAILYYVVKKPGSFMKQLPDKF